MLERAKLGCVDEFDQAECRCEAYDGSIVAGGFLAAQGDALEAFNDADALFDAGAGLVKDLCEEGALVLLVGLVGNDRGDASGSCGGPFALLEYPLSPMAARGATSGPMSSKMGKYGASAFSPPVRSKPIMAPDASDLAWIFVVKPPRERPSA